MASAAKSALATILRILGLIAGTGGLDTVSVNAAGSGYAVNNVLTLVGGNSDGTVTVLTVGGSGEVLTVSRTAPGTGYSVAAGLTTTGGGGTNCTIDVVTLGPGGLDTVSVNAAGTGYAVSNVLTLVGGNSDGTVTVLTIGGSGEVLTVSRTTPGTGYSVAAGLATTGGGGSNCTINVVTVLLPIAELQNIGGPGGRLNMIDVTNHQSPSGAEEVIAGVLVGGEVTLEGNFVNDVSQKQAKTDHQAKTLRSYEIYVPLATPVIRTFSGFFGSLEYSAKYDEKLGFSGAIKATGLPNLG